MIHRGGRESAKQIQNPEEEKLYPSLAHHVLDTPTVQILSIWGGYD